MKMHTVRDLLAKLFQDIEVCYQASNSFTDEKREELLAGARALQGRHAQPVRRF
jgi:hypothetical protein